MCGEEGRLFVSLNVQVVQHDQRFKTSGWIHWSQMTHLNITLMSACLTVCYIGSTQFSGMSLYAVTFHFAFLHWNRETQTEFQHDKALVHNVSSIKTWCVKVQWKSSSLLHSALILTQPHCTPLRWTGAPTEPQNSASGSDLITALDWTQSPPAPTSSRKLSYKSGGSF